MKDLSGRAEGLLARIWLSKESGLHGAAEPDGTTPVVTFLTSDESPPSSERRSTSTVASRCPRKEPCVLRALLH